MLPRVGDQVRILADPDVAQELWDHDGRVVGRLTDRRVLVAVDRGEQVPLWPEHLLLRPDVHDPVGDPFDPFPGPWSGSGP